MPHPRGEALHLQQHLLAATRGEARAGFLAVVLGVPELRAFVVPRNGRVVRRGEPAAFLDLSGLRKKFFCCVEGDNRSARAQIKVERINHELLNYRLDHMQMQPTHLERPREVRREPALGFRVSLVHVLHTVWNLLLHDVDAQRRRGAKRRQQDDECSQHFVLYYEIEIYSTLPYMCYSRLGYLMKIPLVRLSSICCSTNGDGSSIPSDYNYLHTGIRINDSM